MWAGDIKRRRSRVINRLVASAQLAAQPVCDRVGALWVDGTFWFQTGPSASGKESIRCQLARVGR
jgi:hypothetical protein